MHVDYLALAEDIQVAEDEQAFARCRQAAYGRAVVGVGYGSFARESGNSVLMSVNNVKVDIRNAEAHAGVRREILDVRVILHKAFTEHIRSLVVLDERERGVIEHCSLKVYLLVIIAEELIEEGDMVAVTVSAVPEGDLYRLARLGAGYLVHEFDAFVDVLVGGLPD